MKKSNLFWLPTALTGKVGLREGPKNYDIARICENGHIINDACKAAPEDTTPLCSECGAVGIDQCPECKQRIHGARIGFNNHVARRIVGQHLRRPPTFCHACEKPYPWTMSRLAAAGTLISEMEEFEEGDREILRSLLPELVRGSYHAEIAAVRFSELLGKASIDSKNGLKKILWLLVKEKVKRILFP